MKTTTIGSIIVVLGIIFGVLYFMSTGSTTTVPTAPTSYSATTVAKHRTAGDCWSIVNGNVYNLTSWIAAHPGGTAQILAMCGIDASSAYTTQHDSAARPLSELANFKIGALGK